MPLSILPIHRLTPESIKADVVAQVVSGGRALNDEEDVIQTDGGGRWEIALSNIALRTVPQQRLWDAWTSHLAGGSRQVLVPIYSLRTAPRPVGGNGLLRPSGLVTDDDVFPTSMAFASPYIVAQTVGAVGLRATTLTILVQQGARIEAGMRFGIPSQGRVHKIERVVSRSGMQATVVISTPTRAPIAAGTTLDFNWPLVQCRAAPGQDLAPDYRFGRTGSVSVSFVEDFGDVE